MFAWALPFSSWPLPFMRCLRSPIGPPFVARLLSGDGEGETARLRQVRGGRADPRELLLELLRALEVGALQLAAQLPLAQAQEQLLGRLLVDPLGRRTGVELRKQRHELLVRLAGLEQVLPRPPVQVGVEVLGCELG